MTRCLNPKCRQLYPGAHCPRCQPKGRSRGWDWSKVRTQVLIRDNFRCKMCGKPCPHMGHDFDRQGRTTCHALHVDHIKTREAGGTDAMDNLRTTCLTFNLKGACDR